jgi:hypothetical protein
MFQHWLAKHQLPLSPLRFEPRQAGEPDDAKEASGSTEPDNVTKQSPIEGVGSGTGPYSVAGNALRRSRMSPEPEEPGPRKEAWKALKVRFKDELIPDDFTGAQLHKMVNQHIKNLPRDALEGRIRQEISLDTVLRAAGRKR